MSDEAAQWAPLFPEVEIDFIVDAILRCGRGLEKKHPTELETQVSERLCVYLRRDPELRVRPVEVYSEIPLVDTIGDCGVLGRCDIWFLCPTGINKPWPYFVIEAKRLHVTFPSGWKTLIGEYVNGDQGMTCFTRQRYARGLLSGGMLAYVFDGRVDAAREGVAAAIKKASGKLNCKSAFQVISRCGSAVGKTAHRVQRGDFTIYHLFIAV